MYISLIFFLLCILWFIQTRWKKRRHYVLSSKVPGPLSLPIIGTTYVFFRGDALTIAKRFLKLFDDYPELSKFWVCNELYYLVSKPEYLEKILNSPGALDKIDLYKYLVPSVGYGLLSAPAKLWKRHRKIIAPSFNQKILNDYVEAICHQCNILIDMLRKECGKGEIDHCRYITNCAMDIVGDTIFGLPINAQTSNIHYSHAIDILFEAIFLRVFRLFYQFDFIFKRTKEYRQHEELISMIKNLTRGLIEKKIEQLRSQVESDENNKKSFLDVLVEKFLNNEFSSDELEDEVNTFLLAGTDTNATSTSFVFTLLGMHQDIQEKLYEEVMEVLGPDRMVTIDDLPKLKYTERVIKETLRVFPGAAFAARTVEEDIDLGDLIIPKGSNVSLGYLHLHRSEKHWTNPLKFDPDRFLPENSMNRHPYSWLPFSGGPRNCIGIKFGMMVMKIMIPMVIRKFKVTSSIKSIEDIEFTTNIVLKPKNGFSLLFEMR